MLSQKCKDRTIKKVLDYWFKFGADHFDTPGFQVCIRKKGKIFFNKAYGYASLETKARYSTSHMGRLASHSKILTATIVLSLKERKELSLSDPIVKYLGWLKKHPDKRYKEITIRDLLTHRAGIISNGMEGSFWSLEREFPSEKELKEEVLKSPLIFDPNTETKYSNLGYGLISLVLEEIEGKPYPLIFNDFFLKNNSDLAIRPDFIDELDSKVVSGYSKRFYNGQSKPFKKSLTNALAAATGACGNVESMTCLLYRILKEDGFLSEESRKELLSLCWPIKNSIKESYGLGVAFNKTEFGLFIGHSGGFPGFTSQTRLWKGTDYLLGFIANSSDSISLDAIKSVARVISKIEEVFSKDDIENILVSPPLMNWWGASIYVLGKNKALCLPINNWSLGDGSTQFDVQKDGFFKSYEISGYDSVGEPVKFNIMENKIQSVKFGAFVSLPEKEFLEQSQRSFQKTKTI